MINENTVVVLDYKLVGAIKNLGKYNYVEKTSSGDYLPERRRLRVLKDVENSLCIKHVVLSSQFVQHALKTRPHPKQNFDVYKNWRKMSDRERLEYHITQFVLDQDAVEYEFEIL